MDSTLVDSISSFNGTPMGTIGYDTVSFPIPGSSCNLVAVEPIGNIVPNRYSLEQNYLNPFNPSTSISFTIPKGGFVELVVYDILGRKVAVLVSDPFEPGNYKVDFDARNISGGVYFYKLIAGNFTATRKMLLIK